MPSTTATASKPKAWIVATVVTSCLAVAAIVTAALLGLHGPAQSNASSVPAQSGAAAAPVQPGGSAAQSGSAATGQYEPHRGDGTQTPAKAPKDRPTPAPSAAPSAAVKSLQQQLAQLNYYNGSITGYENTATVHAIEYLQRDAHLPQTGQLNAATRAALNNMLVHGNNQMAN